MKLGSQYHALAGKQSPSVELLKLQIDKCLWQMEPTELLVQQLVTTQQKPFVSVHCPNPLLLCPLQSLLETWRSMRKMFWFHFLPVDSPHQKGIRGCYCAFTRGGGRNLGANHGEAERSSRRERIQGSDSHPDEKSQNESSESSSRRDWHADIRQLASISFTNSSISL